MSKHGRWLCLIGLMCWAYSAGAQRLGLLPPGVKWHQLVHDSLRIIFPSGYDSTAMRAASLMLSVSQTDPISRQCRYKPISVLLQPQTNIANGYVGLAPYMSEFFLQPHENPFELGSLPWTDLLAIHETRHVQQLNAANTGISHIIKRVFGDYVFTGAYNLSVPNWYREGDAVYTETKYTRQGRGRLSLFTLPFREKMKEGTPWPYYVVRNGSFKYFTPDHYPLGYLIVQYGNQIFGEATWDTIVKTAPTFKNLFSPFSGVVKEKFGFRNRHMYDEAMQWFGEEWKSREVEETSYPMIPQNRQDQRQDYITMEYPVVEEDGQLLAAVTTFDRTTAICRIHPDGRRTKIVSLGLQQDHYFDSKNQIFVWTELRYDPRWIRRDRQVIVVLDEKRGRTTTIETDKGYFTPSLNESGTRIVALHTDPMGRFSLHILDAARGMLLDSLPNPDNLYPGYPVFSKDGQAIIASARNAEGQMALIEQDISTGAIRQITPFTYAVLGRPVLQEEWIYVTTGVDELDQVYAIHRQDGSIYQVSDGNRAHYDPAWDPLNKNIVSAEYRLDGKKLVRLPGTVDQWKRVPFGDGIKPVAGASDRDLTSEPTHVKEYEIKPYSPWTQFLNVHSWTVTADDPLWGIQVRSDNVMTNLSMAAGYEFNRNSHAGGPYLDIRMARWYPEITLGLRSRSREVKDSEGNEFRAINDFINAGIALPLTFTPGVYQQALRLSSDYNWGIGRLNPPVPGIDQFRFNYLTHRFVMVNSRNRAYRQAIPSWGQRMEIMYSHEATGVPVSQLYMSADMAVPSLRASHYIVFHGEYLQQDIRETSIQLGSNYAGPRGFDFADGEKQYRVGVTYGFPLLYPDIGFGNILYTRRIRMQPFYDIGYIQVPGATTDVFRSAGAEIIIDFDFPPLSVGFRYARLLEGHTGNKNRFEFFIPSQRF